MMFWTSSFIVLSTWLKSSYFPSLSRVAIASSLPFSVLSGTSVGLGYRNLLSKVSKMHFLIVFLLFQFTISLCVGFYFYYLILPVIRISCDDSKLIAMTQHQIWVTEHNHSVQTVWQIQLCKIQIKKNIVILCLMGDNSSIKNNLTSRSWFRARFPHQTGFVSIIMTKILSGSSAKRKLWN